MACNLKIWVWLEADHLAFCTRNEHSNLVVAKEISCRWDERLRCSIILFSVWTARAKIGTFCVKLQNKDPCAQKIHAVYSQKRSMSCMPRFVANNIYKCLDTRMIGKPLWISLSNRDYFVIFWVYIKMVRGMVSWLFFQNWLLYNVSFLFLCFIMLFCWLAIHPILSFGALSFIFHLHLKIVNLVCLRCYRWQGPPTFPWSCKV